MFALDTTALAPLRKHGPMTDRPPIHPDAEELAAFGLGKLTDEAAAALEAHLADCAHCLQQLEGLAGDSFIGRLRGAAAAPTATEAATRVGSEAWHEAPTFVGAAPAPPAGVSVPPELVDHPRYRVLHELGVGGMGVVYKAEHLLMERPVALKVIGRQLTDDPASVERFRREVKAAARLAHPNIVAAYDAEEAGGLHFLVMEFVEGTSLDRLTAQKGRWPITEACDSIRQAALGLQHAFERGMVHRDVKPQNLIRTPEGQVKILDFGLARFARESAALGRAPAAASARTLGESLTQVGSLMGTPDYIAPEQIRDPHGADIRADVYSLGCTLYYLLAGQVPFAKATGLDKLVAQSETQPGPLREFRQDLPVGLIDVLERMMAKDPERRFQTPAAVAQALAVYTTPEGVQLPAPERTEAPSPQAQSRLRSWLFRGSLIGGPLLLFLVLTQTGRRASLGESMETIYTTCAIVGGTLLACQFLMGLLGLGHHTDVGGHDLHAGDGHEFDGHDAHAGGHSAGHAVQTSWFAGMLTFRTAVAGLTFFGLAGRAAVEVDAVPAQSFLVALAAGAAAFVGVAQLMRSLYRLKADGTVHIERAVGQTGTVYLSVPGARAGAGKVHLNLQNRTMEYLAVTAGGPLPTGSRVSVVAVVSPNTVEVIPAHAPERVSHV